MGGRRDATGRQAGAGTTGRSLAGIVPSADVRHGPCIAPGTRCNEAPPGEGSLAGLPTPALAGRTATRSHGAARRAPQAPRQPAADPSLLHRRRRRSRAGARRALHPPASAMTAFKQFLRTGHGPTLFAAFLYFTFSFGVWVLNGAMAPFISETFGLSPRRRA